MQESENLPNDLLDLAQIRQAFAKIAKREGWQVYHTPKNLAAAVVVEAAELLEIFQWLTEEQAADAKNNPATKSWVADEVADVVMYLVELCSRMEINMAEAIAQKVCKNEQRLK